MVESFRTPETFSDFSHTPPLIKEPEALTLYNPFYYDLSTTRLAIDPEWAAAPGITLNWLAQTIDGQTRLVFGVEADTPANFLAFADRFAMGHNLTEQDAVDLCYAGHPTLAHIGTGAPGGADLRSEDVAGYVGSLQNYTGVIGGELRRQHDEWWINDRSGRYGSQRQSRGPKAAELRLDDPARMAAFRQQLMTVVKRKFSESAGLDVQFAP